jgi:ribonuclease P/MRP protein subunit POP5
MKHLPKHLQPRWRYLAVVLESSPSATIERQAFQRECWYAGQNLLGDPGSSEADLSVVRYEFTDGWGTAIVRVRRDETDRGRAALACVDEVDGHDVGLLVCGTSGTIRACEESYLPPAPEIHRQRSVVFEDETQTAVVRPPRVDVQVDGSVIGATELDLE